MYDEKHDHLYSNLNSLRKDEAKVTKQSEEKLTNVNVLISDAGNALLTNEAERNHRSKRKEAKALLEHHLQTYGSNWTEKVSLKR